MFNVITKDDIQSGTGSKLLLSKLANQLQFKIFQQKGTHTAIDSQRITSLIQSYKSNINTEMTNYQVASWLGTSDDGKALNEIFEAYISQEKAKATHFIHCLIENSCFSLKF